MTATMKRFFSYKEIRDYAEFIGMTECRIHYFDFAEGASEDPHGQVFSIDALIDFLKADNLYEQGIEDLAHELIFFNANGFVSEALTA